MMPLHSAIIHFPLALTFILPVLALVFSFMIRSKKMTAKGWMVIIGLQIFVTIMGYVSLETGETDEPAVLKIVEKKAIQAHEEAAELFVGATVLTLVISIGLFFMEQKFQFRLQLLVVGLSLISCFLAYRTGSLGGRIVYELGGAQAHFLKMK